METSSDYQAGTRPKQRRWFVGGLLLLVVIVTGILVLDRSAANSHRIRMQDESHVDPPTPPR